MHTINTLIGFSTPQRLSFYVSCHFNVSELTFAFTVILQRHRYFRLLIAFFSVEQTAWLSQT